MITWHFVIRPRETRQVCHLNKTLIRPHRKFDFASDFLTARGGVRRVCFDFSEPHQLGVVTTFYYATCTPTPIKCPLTFHVFFCMCADRFDGGPEKRQRRRRNRHVLQPAARGTFAPAPAAASSDHRGHAVLTDGFRVDPRGRSGHAVGPTAAASPAASDSRGNSPKHCFRIIKRQWNYYYYYYYLGLRNKSVRNVHVFFFIIYFHLYIILHYHRSLRFRNNGHPFTRHPPLSNHCNIIPSGASPFPRGATNKVPSTNRFWAHAV